MNTKELVLATLEGRSPTRVPRHKWTLAWANNNYPNEVKSLSDNYPDDISGVDVKYSQKSDVEKGNPFEQGIYVDPWGCTFENIQRGVIGEVKSPLVQDEEWTDSDKIHIPEEWLSFDIDDINKQYTEVNGSQFILASACPRPFEQLQFIRGTENFYIDLMMRPKKMMEFIEKMHDFYCRLLTKWAETDVDALNMMDDWGSQNSLLINPITWREIFKPMYKDYIDIAHKANKKMFMHSDGYILDIYPDLIELGLDALNSQIFCMELDNVAKYKGKITFWGEIDRQNLLVTGSVQDIEDAVKLVYEKLWSHGKCIAQCEFGPGAKPENVEAVYRTWNQVL
ncbi:MAG: methyltransferase [Kiritimatiellae bacterium]|jgi:uroporphyrinogen decarboxylase|nr:methyltransferase [Kiritimatiellia bacterium]